MPISPEMLRVQCGRVLDHSDFPALGVLHAGKVRDCYVQDGRRTLIATDRVSAFDAPIGTIPAKGQVLNQTAAFWFERTRHIAPNHLLALPDPQVSVAQECEAIPVEFVMRGYLTGTSPTSIWTAYARGDRVYCGHRLPEGLRQHEALREPLLTPTTKALHGARDEPISRAEALERGLVSEQRFAEAERCAAALFAEGQRQAAERGLILVDTKYEMGIAPDGSLLLIDEIHTPDSSRYWESESYRRALATGGDPAPLDKDYLRRWLAERGFRGGAAPPPLPDDVRCEAAHRYIATYERLTGREFALDTEPPLQRIRRNLGL